MRRAAALGLIGAGEQAQFIVARRFTNLTGASADMHLDMSGLSVGDLGVIFVQNGSTDPTLDVAGGGAGGWTSLSLTGTLGQRTWAFYHVLNGTDLGASNITVQGVDDPGTGIIMGYRYATSAAVRQSVADTGGGTTLAVPAFTLASTSAGVVAIVEEQDTTTGFAPPAVGGLATRLAPLAPSAFWSDALYDFTVPGDYPEATLTWTGFGTPFTQKGHLLELLQ